jgi:hypothetical protein
MTREQYEQRKRRLEEQLQAGIQLLESAHQVQIRALDLVWMLQAEEMSAEAARTEAVAASTPVAPVPPPAPPRRRMPSEVSDDVEAALPSLPETFTRGDVCDALGYEPDRALLYRILQDLRREGRLGIQSLGAGQRATIYRRIDPSDSPADV